MMMNETPSLLPVDNAAALKATSKVSEWVSKLIDWLFNTETSIFANCWGRKPDQSAKYGQRDTMHNTSRYTTALYVTRFVVKHSSYTNATTGYLIDDLLAL